MFITSLLQICGHLLRYFTKISPRRIRTAMDGSSSKLQQVFSSEKLVVEQRTRTYAVQQACGTFLPNSLHLLRLFAKVLIQKLPQDSGVLNAFHFFSAETGSSYDSFYGKPHFK